MTPRRGRRRSCGSAVVVGAFHVEPDPRLLLQTVNPAVTQDRAARGGDGPAAPLQAAGTVKLTHEETSRNERLDR